MHFVIILNKTQSKLSLEPLTKNLKRILKTIDISGIDFDLTLVSNAAIQKLNQKFRKKNKATDVLSFPLHEKKNARKGNVFLGDVVISLAMTREQAKEHGVSFEEELLFLIIHGVLHLLGYDHEKTEKEAAQMQKLERKILNEVLHKNKR